MNGKNPAIRLLGALLGASALAFTINQAYDVHKKMNCTEVYITREDPELISRIEENHNMSDIGTITQKMTYCSPNTVTEYLDKLAYGKDIVDYREMR